MRLDRTRLLEAVQNYEPNDADTALVWTWWEHDYEDNFDWSEQNEPGISNWGIDGENMVNIITQQYQRDNIFRGFRLNSLWVKDDGTYVTEGETNRYSDDIKVVVWGPSRVETVEFLNSGPARPEPSALPAEGDLPSEASFEEEFEQEVAANLQHLPRIGFREMS